MQTEEILIDYLDYNRERINLNKLIHFFRVFVSQKATQALEFVGTFGNINFENLKEKGKKGIILDVDECIAEHHGKILPENLEIIKNLIKNEWKIIIYSNMKKSDRYDELEKLGIPVMAGRYSKPDKRGFLKCVEILGLEISEVVMIGDNFLTDGGAIFAGIDFIKVSPLLSMGVKKSVSRTIQEFTRKTADTLARKRIKY